jgi:hypothetical protein
MFLNRDDFFNQGWFAPAGGGCYPQAVENISQLLQIKVEIV